MKYVLGASIRVIIKYEKFVKIIKFLAVLETFFYFKYRGTKNMILLYFQ